MWLELGNLIWRVTSKYVIRLCMQKSILWNTNMAHSRPDRTAYIIEKEQLMALLLKPSCARTFPYAVQLTNTHNGNVDILRELIDAVNTTLRFVTDIFIRSVSVTPLRNNSIDLCVYVNAASS